jgi:hypothetical protein
LHGSVVKGLRWLNGEAVRALKKQIRRFKTYRRDDLKAALRFLKFFPGGSGYRVSVAASRYSSSS